MTDWRWTQLHRWSQSQLAVYPSWPPKYDWRCARCGMKVRSATPPTSDCPGRVTVPEHTPCDCRPGWKHDRDCVHTTGRLAT